MKTFDLISMCLRNLARRKARTFLTAIGVVVGTCAIVVMVSLGLGMKASQEAMLAQMGDLTVIQVYNYGNGSANGKTLKLDDAMMQQIKSLKGVVVATPFYTPSNFSATICAGKNDRYKMPMYNVTGIYPEALPLLGYELKEGSFDTAFSQPYSMVFGEKAAYNFRDSKKKRGNDRVYPYEDAKGEIPDPFVNPLTEKLTLKLDIQSGKANKKYEYKPVVTAIMKEDWGRGYETSQGVFMNIEDLKKLEAAYKKANNIKKDAGAEDPGYQNAKVKVSDIKYVGEVEQAIKDLGFETYSMETIRKPMEEQTKKQQSFLIIIAGVSLFVAALGIANTMLMSISERTREIGVMKVVGCYVNDIRTVFLMEAGSIGLMGGILGVLLSYLLSFMMNFFGLDIGMGMGGMMGVGPEAGAQMSIIPPWLVLGALAFSICIGLVSGFYPANHAVKISALTAIKQDS